MPLARPWASLLAAAAWAALAACSSQRDPATHQLAAIQAAVDSAQPDAGRYAPAQLLAVQAHLAELNQAYARGDYAGVMVGAPALLEQAQALLGQAAMAREKAMEALRKQWPAYADALPQWLEGLQRRVAALARARRTPAGIDLATARPALEEARTLWGQANAAFAASNLEEALATAQRARERAGAAAAALKMPPPA